MGIGMGQYPFLLSICETPGIRQDNLADALYLNKSSVARALTQLEQNGFLTRTVDPADRRAYCIHPKAGAGDPGGDCAAEPGIHFPPDPRAQRGGAEYLCLAAGAGVPELHRNASSHAGRRHQGPGDRFPTKHHKGRFS